MKRLLAASLALPLLFAALPAARADALPPPLPTGPKVKFAVEVDERADKPHLRIPKSVLQGGAGADKEEAGLFGLPTIIAGLALTAAFVSGGLWLVRRGRGRVRTAAAAVVVIALGALGASAALADIPGPPRPPRPNRPPISVPLALPANLTLSDAVVVEVLDKGDTITLVVNKKAVPDQKPAPSDDKKE